MNEIKTPFIGAAYYPEDWPESEMPYDIAKMQEYGIRAVRIGEFAWSQMEPVEGTFDFTWLHRVVDRLAAAGIRVIMGTPTAAPPIWVTDKDSEMFRQDVSGHRVTHGGRQHACSNNPTYLACCDRIVTALAKEFGRDDNVIGWQIDNELFLQQCHCRHCDEQFRLYLKKKYGTIENLNKQWNLTLFSSAYRSFADISTPGIGWKHPSYLLEYKNFDGETQVAFAARQAAILRQYTEAPLGTDQVPFNTIHYRHMHQPLDLVMFNHYNRTNDLWEAGLWMDYLRNMKDRPFWVTETATCWNGGTVMPGGINRDGYCYANTWMTLALGGEATMYWLWRTHWTGHELMHGSVLESCGRPQYNVEEVKQAAADFDKAADFVNSTTVSTEVALHFTALNTKLFATQAMVYGFEYEKLLKQHFYRPLIDSGLRPDVIDAEVPLDHYKLIFSPLMAVLDENGLPERLKTWIENGGVWVTGPMTDIRRANGSKYLDRYHGHLESLTPAYFRHMVPDADGAFKGRWADGTDFEGSWYYECFEPGRGEDMAFIKSGSRYLEGMSILQQHRVGKGCVIILGTLPDYAAMRRLVTHACALAGVCCDRTEGNSLLVADRNGRNRRGVILVDIGGNGGIYHNAHGLTDILTGSRYTGDIAVGPYQVLVLEEQP